MIEYIKGHLRPVVSEDLALLLAWRNHDRVRDFMFNRHRISEEETRRWFERESADARVHLLLFERDGHPSGYVRFQLLADRGTADWGFYAAPGSPRGTGSALGEAALRHAFTALDAHKVSGQVLAYNAASLRFHERLGFTHEGTLREHHFDGERWHDVHCYGLLENAWAAKRSPTDA